MELSAPQESRCTAHSKSRSGEQCKMRAIPGGNVCRFHGGAAPQVQNKARLRLAALVDPAIGVLEKMIQDAAGRPREGKLALAAAKDALDRAGFGRSSKLELEGSVTVRLEDLARMADERVSA